MTKIINPEAVVVDVTGVAPVFAALWGQDSAQRLGERATELARDWLTDDLCPGGEGYCSARCRRLCGLAR